VDRALGAIGTTFRLTRLYPPSHPAVLEAMRQITAALPALAALGTVEWKIGATGLMWHGQHLLPRNTQVAELAGLLFARGVRSIQINPGVTPEHWLGLFGVAVGNVAPDDAVLGESPCCSASARVSACRRRVRSPLIPCPAAPRRLIAAASTAVGFQRRSFATRVGRSLPGRWASCRRRSAPGGRDAPGGDHGRGTTCDH